MWSENKSPEKEVFLSQKLVPWHSRQRHFSWLTLLITLFHYAESGSAISNEREPRSFLGRVFNIKLGSFVPEQHSCTGHKQPLLELKTPPRFCPVSWSLSMAEWYVVSTDRRAAQCHCTVCRVVLLYRVPLCRVLVCYTACRCAECCRASFHSFDFCNLTTMQPSLLIPLEWERVDQNEREGERESEFVCVE